MARKLTPRQTDHTSDWPLPDFEGLPEDTPYAEIMQAGLDEIDPASRTDEVKRFARINKKDIEAFAQQLDILDRLDEEAKKFEAAYHALVPVFTDEIDAAGKLFGFTKGAAFRIKGEVAAEARNEYERVMEAGGELAVNFAAFFIKRRPSSTKPDNEEIARAKSKPVEVLLNGTVYKIYGVPIGQPIEQLFIPVLMVNEFDESTRKSRLVALGGKREISAAMAKFSAPDPNRPKDRGKPVAKIPNVDNWEKFMCDLLTTIKI